MKQFIKIPFAFSALHKWENAPEHLKYLRNEHKHNFQGYVLIQVFSSDREISFEDAKECIDTVVESFEGKTFTYSCEQFAKIIFEMIKDFFSGREIRIELTEDGFSGVYVEFENKGK